MATTVDRIGKVGTGSGGARTCSGGKTLVDRKEPLAKNLPLKNLVDIGRSGRKEEL